VTAAFLVLCKGELIRPEQHTHIARKTEPEPPAPALIKHRSPPAPGCIITQVSVNTGEPSPSVATLARQLMTLRSVLTPLLLREVRGFLDARLLGRATGVAMAGSL
jgi:hypothetical protein